MTTFNLHQADIVQQELLRLDELVSKEGFSMEYLLERLEKVYAAIRPFNTITDEQIQRYERDQINFAIRVKKQKKAIKEVKLIISKQLKVNRKVLIQGPIPESAAKKLERSALTEEKRQALEADLSLPEPLLGDILHQYNLIRSANERIRRLHHTRRNFHLFSKGVRLFALLFGCVIIYLLETYLDLQLPEGFQFVAIVGAGLIFSLFLEKGIRQLADTSLLQKIKLERIFLYQHFNIVLHHHIILNDIDH
jgi:hypothetical protein